jgi:hypothetical protein
LERFRVLKSGEAVAEPETKRGRQEGKREIGGRARTTQGGYVVRVDKIDRVVREGSVDVGVLCLEIHLRKIGIKQKCVGR